MPDERYDRLVAHHKPKKEVPAKIQVLDTPGLSRNQQDANAQKLGIIREAQVLVHVVGGFAGPDAVADAEAFEDDLILADLQVVNNRVERLKKDITKPRPDREELQKELEALTPVVACLEEGRPVRELELEETQEKATRSFSLLTIKRQLLVLNTADSDVDSGRGREVGEPGSQGRRGTVWSGVGTRGAPGRRADRVRRRDGSRGTVAESVAQKHL